MAKFRNIYDLIDLIKSETPTTFKEYLSFMTALDDVKSSADYRAPECYHINFEQLAEALYAYLGTPDTEWKRRVAGIFNGTIKTNIKIIEINL